MPSWMTILSLTVGLLLQGAETPKPLQVRLPRLEKAPSMAWEADLEGWKGALQVTDFGMIMPDDKGQSRWPTRAYLAFGPDAFYAALDCRDPEPGKVRAWRHQRDAFGDQELAILDLDPSGRGQSCLRFIVTPLGGQMEGLVQDATGEDYSYDCLWESTGVLTPTGYVVKFRIPYTSLRRLPGDWGVRLLRVVPRERRYGIVWPPMSRDIPCDICQMARASGAPADGVGTPFLLIPFATLRREESRAQETLGRPDTTARLGLDLRYSGASLTLDGTLRPDFSNVEADVDPLQINSRFKVFYAEKRPFFLEGMDLLGIQGAQRQFFSRAVLEPLYGLKASGQDTWASWSVLQARDQSGGDALMSEGASGLEGRATRDTAAVARFPLDNRGSGLSLLATDKTLLGSDNAGGRSAGIYLSQWLGKEFQFVGSAVEALSRLPGDSGPTRTLRGSANSAELDWNSRNGYGWVSSAATSPDLVLVSGFTNLAGYRSNGVGLGWQERWNTGILAQARVALRAYRNDWWDGSPMERSEGLQGYLETSGRWSLNWNWDPTGRAWAGGRSCATRTLTLNPAWKQYAQAQVWARATWTRTPDLDSGDPAHLRAWALGSDGNLSAFVYSASARVSQLSREADGSRLVRARQLTASAGYQFPRSIYAKLQTFVVRYDGLQKNTVDKYAKVLVGWQPNAFTHAYLGWSSRVQRDPTVQALQVERLSERGLFAKLAYALQF
jgi:hypothetical protein